MNPAWLACFLVWIAFGAFLARNRSLQTRVATLSRQKRAIGGAGFLILGAAMMFVGFASASAVASAPLRVLIVLFAGLAFVFSQCVAAAMMTSIAIENVSKSGVDSSSE